MTPRFYANSDGTALPERKHIPWTPQSIIRRPSWMRND
jgi:hypothetical protein